MTMSGIVYIVDDDEPIRTSLSEALDVFGFRTADFATASEFLACTVEDNSILISDVRMAGTNGIDLTQYLRLNGSTIPIILLTGHANKALQAEAIIAGADSILEKPVAMAILLAEIERLTIDGNSLLRTAGRPLSN